MELVFLTLLMVLMATALGSGFPVAFSLPGSAIITIGAAALCGWVFAGDVTAYFAQGGPIEWLTAGVTNFRGIYWEVERDTLIAIPLFIFMGIMLQRSRIAEDLLVAMAQLFGPIPGGLGISVIFVGALLAATTGIVGATVVAMGLISLPVMMRHKYSPALATGTIAASGTLGQIIPPSIVLIILADQLASAVDQASAGRKSLYKEVTGQFSMPSNFDAVSTSAGDMFMGAFVPGLVLVAAYMIFMLVIAIVRPKLAPAVPFEGKYDAQFALRVVTILVPPLTLIFVVLGSIILGIATVNQAGAIGAVGATIMAGVRLHGGKPGAMRPAVLAIGSIGVLVVIANVSPINVKNIKTSGDVVALVVAGLATLAFLASLAWAGWRTYKIENTLTSVMVETAKTSSLVFIILLGAAMLTAAFRAFGGEDLVREFLTSLPGGFWTQFVIVMAVIFILGFFLDFIEIAVVVVPIVAPILLMDPGANVTAVWLGVMIGLNIQTSFLTPPFGFALFYLRGVAPAAVKTVQMYKGVIAFILLQLLALGIVAVNPSLVNYLPNRIWLTADTAPPPLNPRLQQCIEDYTFVQYQERGDDLRAAIDLARALDLSYLPKKLQKNTAASFDKAQRTFRLVDGVVETTAAVDAATPDYQPLHIQVRTIQRDMRRLDAKIQAHERQIERLKRDGPDADQARMRELEADVSSFQSEREALLSQVPARWEAEHKAFRNLQAAEEKARKAYRKNIDNAYLPVRELSEIVADTDRLAALEGELVALRARLPDTEPAKSVDEIAAVAKAVGRVAGAKAIRADLSAARRALRAKRPNMEKALKKFDSAITKFQGDLAWRERAKTELLPGLEAYEASIRDTIGLRQQPRIPRAQATELIGCTAKHRDLSLHF
jgi:tripartite ATP-independent transporter DctM subunit